MRNLKDCQAEVFRRSEKRIAARKQRRKRLLAAGIPLALCAAIVAFPKLMPQTRSGERAENMQVACGTEAAAGMGMPAGLVEVTGNSYSYSYTVSEKVQGIDTLICDIVGDAGQTRGDSAIQDEAPTETAPPKQNYQGSGYEIRVSHADGREREYLLVKRALVDLQTGQRFELSEEEYEDLMCVLEIPGD